MLPQREKEKACRFWHPLRHPDPEGALQPSYRRVGGVVEKLLLVHRTKISFSLKVTTDGHMFLNLPTVSGRGEGRGGEGTYALTCRIHVTGGRVSPQSRDGALRIFVRSGSQSITKRDAPRRVRRVA